MVKDSERPRKQTKKDRLSAFAEALKNQAIEQPKYTKRENEYRLFLLERMETARNSREARHDEFNGMTYTERYVANMKANNSYAAPRKNKEEVNVVTGTTREKSLAVVSAVLNLNLESTVRAFDMDNIENQELGEGMTDCVYQSNILEKWEDKKLFAYWELVTQGDVFVEDAYVDEVRIDKPKIKISDVTEDTLKNWKPTKKSTIVFSGCQRTVLAGTQVYLGNIKERDIWNQPFIFTREVMSYARAKAIYGHLPRWKNVPKDLLPFLSEDEVDHWGMNWRLEGIGKGMVEVLKYQDKWNDEYQIMLNGVMQLPVEFPMPWEFGEYNITQGRLEPITAFFAYSKSIPSKSQLDQEILDEMYRLAVLKTQKSFMPPIANYSKNILSRSMFLPGKVNNNLKKGEVEVLGGDSSMYGIKPGEFQMIEMIKKFINEKSIDPVLQGESPSGNPTATEVMTVAQQAKQRLGLMIFGFVQFHVNLDTLRLYTVLDNYTKENGEQINKITGKLEKKFRTIEVERDLGERGRGMKEIQFTDNRMSPMELYDMEEGITRNEAGEPVSVEPPKKPRKILQLSPTVLRQIKFHWYVEVVPVDKETSLANRIAFEDSLARAAKLFGLQSINLDYAKMQWAVKNKLNPTYFFVQNSTIPSAEDIANIQDSSVTKQLQASPTGQQEAVRQGYGA